MNKNVGGIDKVLRIVVGVVLIGYALAGPSMGMDTGYNAWGWLGVLPLATALINFCPAYAILGLRTNKSSDS